MVTQYTRWGDPEGTFSLTERDVHVWRIPLETSPASLEGFLLLLDAAEKEKARRFRFERDRRRYIVAHGVLRMLLGAYLQMEASALRFVTNAYGKPALAPAQHAPHLSFNLSHSHELALLAVTWQRELGVDVEYKRNDIEYDELARHSFSPYEQEQLRTLPAALKEDGFFSCWTRKEAYIKARGMGLSLALNLFDVSLHPAEQAQFLASREDPREVERWSLLNLEPGSGYAGALMVEGNGWDLHLWQWPGSRKSEQ
ncbi:MAG TPA: 4'-phosphopantetheinyl transferase superfamily protein [Ktedonobacteraceae bacterium]|nr:4'-phosphopantetheinyl transferase superfamily protein [Ktedonobacteraceae bacterium]